MVEHAKILIVDDEPFNVSILEQELEDLGYETISAADGVEALEMTARARPDLILLDIMMPRLDGFAVCRRLKGGEETRLIPIIMMTALDGFDDRIKGIEAGADDFLTKPVSDRELKARIRTALAQKQAVDRQLAGLRTLKDAYAKFVPAAMQQLLSEDPDASTLAKRELDVSVLFLDISGYARLCEALPLTQVDALVERYFSRYFDHIHEAGGEISETVGDGLMVIFQNDEQARHARDAANAALALFAATAALNAEAQDTPLQLHMGLASGPALVGSTRIEGERGTRWVFTATGPVTNLAARLATLAEADSLLVGPETAARLAGHFALEALGEQALKNLARPVEVHRVAGPLSK